MASIAIWLGTLFSDKESMLIPHDNKVVSVERKLMLFWYSSGKRRYEIQRENQMESTNQ